jgi:cyclophilin family peptidyl-prolyl cis-trans isomerase
MSDRIWKVDSRSRRYGAGSRPGSKHSRRQPLVEVLEGRQLLTASLAPITSFSPPAQSGYQLPLLVGSNSTTSNQTFTATSSNPNIKVSVAPQVVGTQGQYWTITVNNESMTFQLFGDLTPQTVDRIVTLSNGNYYTTGDAALTSTPANPGKYFPRITSVSNAGVSVLQGGSTSATSTTSTSGLTPLIATEPVQQLAFTGQYQLAMANTGGSPGTLNTDAQFFITNGTLSQSFQQAWDFNYTIFGQLVSGQQTVTDLSKVAVTTNTSTGEDSQPITPVVINSVGFSSTNPNGVLHIDTTGATAGQTATITVTATDPIDHTTATRSFTVTTAGNTGAVHLIDKDVLVVTPPPRTDHGTDNIEVSQQNPTGTGTQSIVVTVNGVPDVIQPPANSLLQIIVFGSKASTDIQVDPNVSPTIPITLDGGHGGDNVIQAGSGPTREHGWFGHTLLIGGTGSDALIGRKGFVRFKPTTTTNLIYAGVIKPRFKHRTVAPSGTYYRFEKGRLVPVLTT